MTNYTRTQCMLICLELSDLEPKIPKEHDLVKALSLLRHQDDLIEELRHYGGQG